MAPALRRAQPADDPVVPVEAPAPPANDMPPGGRPFVERRQADRRGMDRLRAEALQTIITQVEDRNFGGLKNRVSLKRRLPFSRILLIGVALLAGGVAAMLALQRDDATPAVTAPVEQIAVPAMKVLVAARQIAPGATLTADSLLWQDWPTEGLQPDYITSEASPGAIAENTGAMARAEIYPGEPIRSAKLTRTGAGYLAATLDAGTRAVSIPIAPESASGGFIVPGDYVDVVLTRATATGRDTQTILQSVRVLAIDAQLDPQGGTEDSVTADSARGFSGNALATLALTPTAAEVIINATSTGSLSLMLRPVVETSTAADAEQRAANAAIRLSSPFWAPQAPSLE